MSTFVGQRIKQRLILYALARKVTFLEDTVGFQQARFELADERVADTRIWFFL